MLSPPHASSVFRTENHRKYVIKHTTGASKQWSKPPQSQTRRMRTRSAGRSTGSSALAGGDRILVNASRLLVAAGTVLPNVRNPNPKLDIRVVKTGPYSVLTRTTLVTVHGCCLRLYAFESVTKLKRVRRSALFHTLSLIFLTLHAHRWENIIQGHSLGSLRGVRRHISRITRCRFTTKPCHWRNGRRLSRR